MDEQENGSSFKPGLVFWVGIVCLLGLFAWAAIPNFVLEPNTSPENACINNLRQIDAAKQQWGIEHKKTSEDFPTWDDIAPYFGRESRGAILKCPLGGIYTIGALSNNPTCSLPGHIMR